ncbi:ABC transporter ATP-binding protein [Salinibacterium soli]|uniref:ABC transporter ATP-binding protein n=1 Tax=Antiquaquibacter soli TaxID=3064523 RepID=A0ABT9BN74_9MICO|nr:ABC transporter ATP-binding protein [Protaetiibacter sp. WY-16]MDO7882024.1 ABC transporter ATP-binding protein [Protaetiibacter sp. WY-16]
MPSTDASPTAPALSVSLDGVGRSFPASTAGEPDRRVLRDISLEIAPGEIISLLGPSGCGKSTLLRQVSGLDRPDEGVVTIDGSPLVGIDQRCAIGFQEPRLLPWRTLEQNVALGLPHGTPRSAGRERVSQLLDLVQLGDAKHLRPRQVSGGMAQRASLARALSRGPGVLVLDEPFGALDALTRLTMQDLLLEIHAAEPATILLVTHDVDEALYLSDRVVLLGTEPGERAGSGAVIRSIITVPGSRPRDRGDSTLAHLRAELLQGLGVSIHHPAHTF